MFVSIRKISISAHSIRFSTQNMFFTIKVSKSLGTRMNKKLLLCVLNFYFQLGYFSKDKDNLKFPDNQKDLSESISFGTPKNISILFRI